MAQPDLASAGAAMVPVSSEPFPSAFPLPPGGVLDLVETLNVDRLKSDFLRVRDENARLTQELADLHKKQDELVASLQSSERKHSDAIITLTTQVVEFRRSNRDLQEENKALHLEVTALKASVEELKTLVAAHAKLDLSFTLREIVRAVERECAAQILDSKRQCKANALYTPLEILAESARDPDIGAKLALWLRAQNLTHADLRALSQLKDTASAHAHDNRSSISGLELREIMQVDDDEDLVARNEKLWRLITSVAKEKDGKLEFPSTRWH